MPREHAALPVPVPPAPGERVEGEVVGTFIDGQFVVRAPYASDAIIDPQPELDRQHALAFNASGRASGSPLPAKPGRFHRHSLRRG